MIYYREYGVAAVFNFVLYDIEGVGLKTDAVYASGDATIMKNEGAEANTANGFVDEGKGYSITLTATEMQAARIMVYIVDQTSPAVWIVRELVIETYGETANAQHDYS